MSSTVGRRGFLCDIGRGLAVLAGSLWLEAGPCRAAKGIRKRPNILLIVSDDQGWGDVSCYWDDTDVETPAIDELARTGVRFTQFYVNPLCAPSRASLLTGQYSMENGVWRGPSKGSVNERRIRDDVRTLPEILKRAGYRTGIFGKWHLGYESPDTPNERGFDEFYGFLGGAHPYRPTATQTLMHNSRPYQEDLHLTDYFTEKALSFIRDCADRRKPFFCYVPYNAVHGPLWLPDRPRPSGKKNWLELYSRKGVDYPRLDYNAILGHMDDSVGRLVNLLKDLELEEDTLVIFLSDNGACLATGETKANYPGNNGPFRGGKGSTYEGGIRVPCIMRWKGRFPEHVVSNELAMHFDIFATVLNAAGLEAPRTNGRNPVHGISLIEHIVSGCAKPLPQRTVFWELAGKVAVRRGRWKLAGQVESPRGRWRQMAKQLEDSDLELYDLDNDIDESEDLREKHPAEYLRLRKELITFFESVD